MTNDQRIEKIENMLEQVIERIQSMEHEINQLFLRWEQAAREEERTAELYPVCQKVITYDNRREN